MNNENDKANLTIVDVKDESTVLRPWDDYYNVFDMSLKCIKIEDFCRELIDWSKSKGDAEKGIREPFRVEDFLNMKGMPRREYDRLKEKYEILRHANEFAMSNIASNREYGAASKLYNDATIARTAGWYQPEVRQEQERLAALQKNSMPDQKLILMIPAAPNSDEVKFRQLKNESIDVKVREE